MTQIIVCKANDLNVYFRQTQWDPPNIDQGESSEQGDQDDMDLDTPPQEVLQTKVSGIPSPIMLYFTVSS